MIVSDRLSSTLTVQVYSTFTIRWLLPRLAEFQKWHPELQVRLHTAQDDANFDQDDIDAAIMIGSPVSAAVDYTPLFTSELFPVCSPQYYQERQPSSLPPISMIIPSYRSTRLDLIGTFGLRRMHL